MDAGRDGDATARRRVIRATRLGMRAPATAREEDATNVFTRQSATTTMGDDDVEDEDIDAWLDSDSDETSAAEEVEDALEEASVVVDEEGAKDDDDDDGDDGKDDEDDDIVVVNDAETREDVGEDVGEGAIEEPAPRSTLEEEEETTIETVEEEEDVAKVEDVPTPAKENAEDARDAEVDDENPDANDDPRRHRPLPPLDVPDVRALTANFGSWASASFSKARLAVKQAADSDVARQLRKDLKEFGSHVVGDDDARTRLVRREDDEGAEEDGTPTTSEPPPNARDAMRFAESFAAGAWSAFGGAANKAKEAFEKAEGVIEKAASDPKTFAKDVRGKAQTVGMGAFSALSSVVKSAAEVLATEDDDERAEQILIERLEDLGAEAHRDAVESACERAMDALTRGVSEEEQRRVRDLVRDLDKALTSNDESVPTSPETAPTLVAVPLDDGLTASVETSAETLMALISEIDARSEDASSALVRLARGGRSTDKSSGERCSDVIVALEDAMFDLRDELVCDGLAKLTTSTLKKIRRAAEDGDSALSRQDAMRKAANARATIAGHDEDVKVFIEAVKEAMTTVAGKTGDAFSDSWPANVPTPRDVVSSTFDQIHRDETSCVELTRRTLRQLAWVIAVRVDPTR